MYQVSLIINHIFETCVSRNNNNNNIRIIRIKDNSWWNTSDQNNLLWKIVAPLESQITFDEKFKVTFVLFFIIEFE